VNILLINWQDPANPHAGGAEIHLQEVFTRIAAGGHGVTWLASGWPGAAECDRIGAVEIRRTGSRYTFGIAAPRYYRRYLRELDFDVTVEALNKVPLYSPLWSRSPTILLVHHLFGRTAFREASPPIAALTWLQERPIARVYRDVPVQVISQSTATDLRKRGVDPASIKVIHPGVDLEFFRADPSRRRTADPTFLYLGRLRRYKRVDLVIRAFAMMTSRHPRARLLIAGRGNAERGLRRLAERLDSDDRIEFTGYVTEEEKRDLFRRCWANVFVSPKEGWGITNLEAAACGTPTIASDSPGLRESVLDGRTGLLVRHGDAHALSFAMSRIAAEPGLADRLGVAAADFARSFTWDRTAAETESHLLAHVTAERERTNFDVVPG
jgi:glycosyltransferase involved in cell wall biosynthesis